MSKAYNLAIHKRLMGYNLMDSPFIRKPKSDKPTKKVVAFTVEEENDFLNYLNNIICADSLAKMQEWIDQNQPKQLSLFKE